MRIIPSIDLYNGQMCRLIKGKKNSMTCYGMSPITYANILKNIGIKRLHIVDLNNAFGEKTNINDDIIKLICSETDLSVDIGGGIRSLYDALKYIEYGASNIVLGTIAITDSHSVLEIASKIGRNNTILASDVLDGKIVTHGWETQSTVNINDFIKLWYNAGFKKFLCTDVNKDGMLQGPSNELYREILSNQPKIHLIASGGINNIESLIQLNEIGVSSAIIGKAIFEQKITLSEIEKWIQQNS